jgi:hypothetical protein
MPCETSCPVQGGAGYALFERVHKVHDLLAARTHILRNFHVLDLVEVFFFVSDFVGVSKERPHKTLVQRLQSDDVLAAGQHNAADCDHVHVADRLSDHCEGVVPTLPSGRR